MNMPVRSDCVFNKSCKINDDCLCPLECGLFIEKWVVVVMGEGELIKSPEGGILCIYSGSQPATADEEVDEEKLIWKIPWVKKGE